MIPDTITIVAAGGLITVFYLAVYTLRLRRKYREEAIALSHVRDLDEVLDILDHFKKESEQDG